MQENKTIYWSKRNYIFKSQKYGWLLYAGLSNSFFHLSDGLKETIDSFKAGDKELPEDVRHTFLKTGVVSEYTEEELSQMYILNWAKTLAGNEKIYLTIAPTLNCNFRCVYCYEKNNRQHCVMDSSTADSIIEFVKTKRKTKADIEWYGGEPLLCFDFIKQFNEKAAESNIKLSQSIVTNGYLLTEEVIKYFASVNLRQIQITLDGARETHNKRRPHVTNPDSYDRILDNLDVLYTFCMTHNYHPAVSIRVNVDRTNEDDFPTVKNYLHDKYNDFFYVYYGIVTDANSCLDKSDSALTTNDQRDFIRRLDKKYGITDRSYFPPTLGNDFCAAQMLDNYVIDPDEYLYKCWDDVGDKTKAVYSLKDKKFRNLKQEAAYIISTQAAFLKECSDCILLYTCQGGCPHKRLEKKNECLVLKDNMDEFLERYYEISQHKDFVL